MSSMESMNSDEPLQSSNANATNSNTDTDEQLKLYLLKAMNRTVKGFIGNLKFSLFKSSYPEIYKQCSSNMIELHRQLKSQLMESIQKEEEDLCKEVNLYSSISLLGNLIKNHKGNSDVKAWRPSGNPTDDMRDHLYQMKLKNKRCLEFTLQTLALQNEGVEKIVDEKHKEILSAKERVDRLSTEIRNRFIDASDGSIEVLRKQISGIPDDTLCLK